ncbi:MAG: hypothetical protein LBP51_02600, partial [Deferribacteraceae bacterium]|nr:hypothetical protein [Deferribacteraceae bacterium]
LSSLDAAALLTNLEKVTVAARLRLDEYACKDYDFINGHSEVYLSRKKEGFFIINDWQSSAHTNITTAAADARCAGFFTEPHPLYAGPSQAEINFDKKSFHR